MVGGRPPSTCFGVKASVPLDPQTVFLTLSPDGHGSYLPSLLCSCRPRIALSVELAEPWALFPCSLPRIHGPVPPSPPAPTSGLAYFPALQENTEPFSPVPRANYGSFTVESLRPRPLLISRASSDSFSLRGPPPPLLPRFLVNGPVPHPVGPRFLDDDGSLT